MRNSGFEACSENNILDKASIFSGFKNHQYQKGQDDELST